MANTVTVHVHKGGAIITRPDRTVINVPTNSHRSAAEYVKLGLGPIIEDCCYTKDTTLTIHFNPKSDG